MCHDGLQISKLVMTRELGPNIPIANGRKAKSHMRDTYSFKELQNNICFTLSPLKHTNKQA